MLYSLFKRAEASVDNAITAVLARALVAVPFLVAAAYLTAALDTWLHQEMDAPAANFVMALVFLVIGLVLGAIVWARSAPSEATSKASPAADETEGVGLRHDTAVGPVDRDLIVNTISAVGPTALPVLLKTVMRNLPLVVAVTVAGFIVSKASRTEDDSRLPGPSLQPGE